MGGGGLQKIAGKQKVSPTPPSKRAVIRADKVIFAWKQCSCGEKDAHLIASPRVHARETELSVFLCCWGCHRVLNVTGVEYKS